MVLLIDSQMRNVIQVQKQARLDSNQQPYLDLKEIPMTIFCENLCNTFVYLNILKPKRNCRVLCLLFDTQLF